jgi:hypothetical protein
LAGGEGWEGEGEDAEEEKEKGVREVEDLEMRGMYEWETKTVEVGVKMLL